MTVLGISNWQKMARLMLVALMTLAAAMLAAPAQAATERALYLHYVHTKETARIVFKRNGQYVQSGLNELNVFLRDWRRNEPAKMDPRLFDLVWEVYQEVGGTEPIHVVSAYRSPATNAMLAKTSSGVADNSQHMRGTAMDFYIPGVPLAKLRTVAMRKQVGGVGYYPTSGSPFVHLDTGSVRSWPRMTRAQLAEVFPDGRTMHLPADGKPLSQEGYQIALAEWKRCQSYPCRDTSSGTSVASNSGGSGRTLMDVLFGGNDKAAPQTQVAAAAAPAVQTASLAPQQARATPVMPAMRPADLGGPTIAAAEAQQVAAVAAVPAAPVLPFSTSGSAPLTPEELGQVPRQQVASVAMPVMMPADLRGSMASGDNAVTAIAAATAVAMPTPRVIMSNPPSETLSAYLPTNSPDPEAQRALDMIISTSTTGSTTPTPTLPRLDPRPVVASAGLTASAPTPQPAAAPVSNLFQETFGATQTASAQPLAAALADHVAKREAATMRQRDLVAPDLNHVADILMTPAPLHSNHFAVITDHTKAADFDPATEMGMHVLVKGVGDTGPVLGSRFTVN